VVLYKLNVNATWSAHVKNLKSTRNSFLSWFGDISIGRADMLFGFCDKDAPALHLILHICRI